MLEKYSIFKEKVFIDIHTGNKFGYISDMEIELTSGRICKIFLTKEKGFCCSFLCGKKEREIIEWNEIRKIGDDAVLVDKKGPPRPPFVR